jgi:hypothetical protein
MWLLDDRPELRTNQTVNIFWSIRRFLTLMDLLAAKSCGGAETRRIGDRDRGRIKGQAVTRQDLFRINRVGLTTCRSLPVFAFEQTSAADISDLGRAVISP